MDGSLERKDASCGRPSWSVTRIVTASPNVISPSAGKRVSAVTLATTSRVVDPVTPAIVARRRTWPGDTATTTVWAPVPSTRATTRSLTCQMTSRPLTGSPALVTPVAPTGSRSPTRSVSRSTETKTRAMAEVSSGPGTGASSPCTAGTTTGTLAVTPSPGVPPAAEAMISAMPSPTAITTPAAETRATSASVVSQRTSTLSKRPPPGPEGRASSSASSPTCNRTVSPGRIEREATATAATGTCRISPWSPPPVAATRGQSATTEASAPSAAAPRAQGNHARADRVGRTAGATNDQSTVRSTTGSPSGSRTSTDSATS